MRGLKSPLALLVERLVGPRILLPDRLLYAEPGDFGLQAERVDFPRPGGGRLKGLWVPARGTSPGSPGAAEAAGLEPHGELPPILFCPGNSANLSGHLPYLALAARAGLPVLGLDYSGFGASDGPATLSGLLADTLAALEALQGLTGRREGLGVFGVSLGANLALELAARSPAIRAAAVEGLLIQEEAVAGILAAGHMGPVRVRRIREEGRTPRDRLRLRLRPPGPPAPAPGPRRRAPWDAPLARLLARLATWSSPLPGKDPLDAARRLAGKPVFLVHGIEDLLLPFEAALEVRRRLPGESRLWLIPGAGHAQEPALLCSEEYSAQLRSFFGEAGAGALLRPSLSVRLERRGEALEAEVELRGPRGPYLVSLLAGEDLHLLSLWAEGANGTEGLARRRIPLARAPEVVEALRYHHAVERHSAVGRQGTVEQHCAVERGHAVVRDPAEGRYHAGDWQEEAPREGSWEALPGPEGLPYEEIKGVLKELSGALLQGRTSDAARLLAAMEDRELPPALEVVRKLHRARLERLGGREARAPSGGGPASPGPAPLQRHSARSGR